MVRKGPKMQRVDEKVLVSTNRDGEPVGFMWRDSNYRVSARPVRWFARRDWWIEATRVQRGVGASVLEVEMWRMTATKNTETDGENQYEIVHTLDGEKGIWRLVRVLD